MHIERALKIINLTEIPERKRKFWPQSAVVILGKNKEILDVVQYFGDNHTDVAFENMEYYPGSVSFSAQLGWYNTVEELRERIESCFDPVTDDTYIVGKGLVRNLSQEEKEKALNDNTIGKRSILHKIFGKNG